eukprot:1332383-Pyramimonas_sp.AAC.1
MRTGGGLEGVWRGSGRVLRGPEGLRRNRRRRRTRPASCKGCPGRGCAPPYCYVTLRNVT